MKTCGGGTALKSSPSDSSSSACGSCNADEYIDTTPSPHCVSCAVTYGANCDKCTDTTCYVYNA